MADCIRAVLVLVASIVGVVAPLHAQYPYVPPPVPCEPVNGHWGSVDADAAGEAPARRIAIIPFTTNFNAADSANADVIAAFSRRLVTRLDDLHAVPLWMSDPLSDSSQMGRLVALGAAEHVDYVLVGTVEPAKEGITVTARLFRTARGKQVWSGSYSGSLPRLLTIETDIARAVELTLGAQSRRAVAGPRPTTSGSAYLAYLRGDADLRDEERGAAVNAMDEFSNAVALDSTFAAGWSGLAVSAVARLERDGGATPADDSALLGVASYAVRHAMRLAPQSASTWLARAAVLTVHEPRDYANAIAAYRHAIDLAPWSADAHRRLGRALIDVGATDEGQEQLRVALRQGPGDPETWVELADLHLMQGDYRAACHAADAAIAGDPRHATAYAARAYVRLRLKDLRNAYADAETGTRLGAWLTGGVASVMASAAARDTASARQRLGALIGEAPRAADRPSVWVGHYLARAYATLGENDRALALLDRARPRGASLWWALHDPSFDRLRGAPVFESIESESGPATVTAAARPAALPSATAPTTPATPAALAAAAASATPEPLAAPSPPAAP